MFKDGQCDACEEYGAFRLWTGGVATQLCAKHEVQLSEWMAALPEFREYQIIEMAWREYLAKLAGGAQPDPRHGQSGRNAMDNLAVTIREQLATWRVRKTEMLAKKKREASEPPETTAG